MSRFKEGDVLVVSPRINSYPVDRPPGVMSKMQRVGQRVAIVRIVDTEYQYSAYGVPTTLYSVTFLEDNPFGRRWYFLEEWLEPITTIKTASIYDYHRKENDNEKV